MKIINIVRINRALIVIRTSENTLGEKRKLPIRMILFHSSSNSSLANLFAANQRMDIIKKSNIKITLFKERLKKDKTIIKVDRSKGTPIG